MEDIEGLKQELIAPVRTIRLFAIENLLVGSRNSENVLKLLIECLEAEQDSECKMLLEHAINNTRLHLSTNPTSKIEDAEKLLQKYLSKQPSQQLEVIAALNANAITNKNSELTLNILLNNSSHPVVTAQIIKKFCRLFPNDKIPFLKQNLFHESISLRLASLEALSTVYPAELKDSFAKLVLSKEPVIRALAIRGLAKTSPLFASDFLAEFLEKGNIYGKLAAMRVCSVIDFSLIKNSILNILIKETDKKLLKIASSIILTNPDKEMPFRLYDLLEKVSENKKVYINGILKNYCKILKATNICEDYDKYFQNLKQYVTNSQKRNYVINLLENYTTSSKERKFEIRKLLSNKIKTDISISDIVKKWKLENGDSEFTIANLPSEEVKTASKSPKERLPSNIFEDLDKLEIAEQQEKLQVILNNRQCKPELKALAFHFAINNNIGTFATEAINSINVSSDELTAVAFEYLSIFDKETFLLKMRRFATSDSILIRTVLISKASKDFPDDAKSLLNSMLTSSIPLTRKKALGAVIHFEFSFIKPLLLNFLKRETEKDLFIICLSFFQSNPLIESIYDLRKIGDKSKYNILFTETIAALRKTLDFLKIATEEEIDKYISERKTQEESLALQKQQNKHLDNIKKKIDWAAMSELNEDGQITRILLALAILFGVIFGVLYLSDGETSTSIKNNKPVFQPILANIQEYKVTVIQVNSNQTILVSDEKGRKLQLSPRAGREFSVFTGDKLTLIGMPHKIDSNGILIVKTLKLVRR